MSKIGTRVIDLPAGVSVEEASDTYVVKGPKGELAVNKQSGTRIEVDNSILQVVRENDQRQSRANHGLLRSLLNNAVTGVTEQFKKELSLVGVGYRAKMSGKNVEFSLGYSHPIVYQMPAEVTAEVPDQTTIVVTSIDRQKVGQVAAEMRSLRPPEPYKGKGVLYKGERIIRKAGKSAAK